MIALRRTQGMQRGASCRTLRNTPPPSHHRMRGPRVLANIVMFRRRARELGERSALSHQWVRFSAPVTTSEG